MINWKKLSAELLKKGVDVASEVKSIVTEAKESVYGKSLDTGNLVTEDDILKAIEDLPTSPIVEEPEVPNDSFEINEELKTANMVKVPIAGIWGTLEYTHKPDMHGLESVKIDERPYFTIPVGWTYDDSMDIQYWYMTFPLGGTEDDIIEFYSPYKLDEINFPGDE